MNRIQYLLPAILLAIILSSCAPPRVIQFLNENLDFSEYQTYRMINYKSNDKSFSVTGSAIFNRLETAIDSNLTVRNYQMADEPDIVVRYEIISTIETQTNNQRYDPYNSSSYYFSPPYNYNNNAKKITQGVLLIEFRDKKKKKLIWQGSLDLKFSKKSTPADVITAAVDRIFTTYPYQAGNNDTRNAEF